MDLLIPLALAALLIFFLFNSRRKQKARAEQIKSGLVPGATVMTTFGVFGTVLSIDEENNQVTIESGPGTVLRVHRQAIGQIENNQAAAPVDASGAAAPAADVDAADDEKPAITDAELDAMNERKRAEKDTPDDASDDVIDDESVAKTEDADAEAVAETEDDSAAAESTDPTDSDADKKN
ncbi:Preprotein translocase subunit [Brevibacterium iodinum ATCC 49514]|uniref:Preprotein translocase subunit n=1 Tax=Brevibacterium iodinum ATCC 49514 TaxID=1255616 RepID=A0A2H1KC45_9MICO|nr:preprotein translocase subunit YajC [Brevibacterium iodinum]SMX97351.1 Preprotein translocase subunit [Brevibacterium iodinum ATCC 49514]SUW12683.1 preprotein translocase subunit YajC [Brevibacterium iodinum]